MTLRITNAEDLKGMSSAFREQLGKQMASVTRLRPQARARYREEDAGRLIVQFVDTLVVDCGVLGRVRVAEYFKHVPNGGARSPTEAAILKGQGVRAGWPDYEIHIPRGPYLGLVAELKSTDGQKPDDAQLDILIRLERMGYRAMVWFGFDDAQRQLLEYFRLAIHNSHLPETR